MTKLGISLGLSPREHVSQFVEVLQTAESLGVEAAWILDSQLAMKDAYVALAVAARETASISIGPGVTNLVTRHETVVANAIATLDDLSQGRVILGLGTGDSAVFPIGKRPLALADCERGIRRLQRLLGGGTVEIAGAERRLSFAPLRRPPVFFAASQPGTLRLAGRVADGVIVMGPSDPSTVRSQLAEVDAGARTAGRDPKELERDLWVTMSVGEGDAPLRDVKSWCSAQARWMTTWRELPERFVPYAGEMEQAARDYDFSAHLSLSAHHLGLISDGFARLLAVVGTPEECGARLGELVATGVDRITVSLLSGGRLRRLRDIAEVWSTVALGAQPASPGRGGAP
jgi:5,10-methylenetetrahydromethanopterin reductase